MTSRMDERNLGPHSISFCSPMHSVWKTIVYACVEKDDLIPGAIIDRTGSIDAGKHLVQAWKISIFRFSISSRPRLTGFVSDRFVGIQVWLICTPYASLRNTTAAVSVRRPFLRLWCAFGTRENCRCVWRWIQRIHVASWNIRMVTVKKRNLFHFSHSSSIGSILIVHRLLFGWCISPRWIYASTPLLI